MLEFSNLSFATPPWAVILAAGKGTRLAKALNGRRKQFLEMDGVPLFWHSVRTLNRGPRLGGIVFVFPEEMLQECEAIVRELADRERFGLTWRCVAGGERRQDSVRNGLAAVPFTAEHVLVHDAARPFFSTDLVSRILDTLGQGAHAAIPAIPVTDTIKVVTEGAVRQTLDRSTLFAVQTPQGFARAELLRVHNAWKNGEDSLVTDDASMMEASGETVLTVPGEDGNFKITNEADIRELRQVRVTSLTGFGYDVHRYGGNRPFVLGGVAVATDLMLEAHSDGDVLLHALMDAMLGLCGVGDIGDLFPDKDPQYDGISSVLLLKQVLQLLEERRIRLTHVDCTVVAQKPRLLAFKEPIRQNLARLTGLDAESVSVKATTEEKLGFTGEVLGIKCYAIVNAERSTSVFGQFGPLGPVDPVEPVGPIDPVGLIGSGA